TCPGATTFTVALEDFVGSALLVAVTETVTLSGPAGAVYMPAGSIVPAVAVHVTAVSFTSAAMNCIVWPVPMAAVGGLTDTLTGCFLTEELSLQPAAKMIKQTTLIVRKRWQKNEGLRRSRIIFPFRVEKVILAGKTRPTRNHNPKFDISTLLDSLISVK